MLKYKELRGDFWGTTYVYELDLPYTVFDVLDEMKTMRKLNLGHICLYKKESEKEEAIVPIQLSKDKLMEICESQEIYTVAIDGEYLSNYSYKPIMVRFHPDDDNIFITLTNYNLVEIVELEDEMCYCGILNKRYTTEKTKEELSYISKDYDRIKERERMFTSREAKRKYGIGEINKKALF